MSYIVLFLFCSALLYYGIGFILLVIKFIIEHWIITIGIPVAIFIILILITAINEWRLTPEEKAKREEMREKEVQQRLEEWGERELERRKRASVAKTKLKEKTDTFKQAFEEELNDFYTVIDTNRINSAYYCAHDKYNHADNSYANSIRNHFLKSVNVLRKTYTSLEKDLFNDDLEKYIIQKFNKDIEDELEDFISFKSDEFFNRYKFAQHYALRPENEQPVIILEQTTKLETNVKVKSSSLFFRF